ncbi:MAG: hypothetical protein ACYTAS_24340, partial [Planctomycetota bacterium]
MQLQAGRIIMTVCFAGTCTYLFLIGRHLIGTLGAMFSLLCYVALVFMLPNAASFRPDTPATFLFLFSLHQFMTGQRPRFAGIVAGVSMALACALTIKASLYFVVFVGLFIVRSPAPTNSRNTIQRSVSFITSFVVAGTFFYYIHAPKVASADVVGFPRSFTGLYSRYFAFHLHPHWGVLRTTLIMDTATWL